MRTDEFLLKAGKIHSVRQMDTESKDRLFTGWASVEITDSDGELLKVSEIEKHMNTLMGRNGPIMDMHSNRPVGQILNWQVKDKKVEGKGVPGILITAKIYDDYDTDHMVWEKIKSGEYTGLSFGGAAHNRTFARSDGQVVQNLSGLENHEISVVDNPANPEALFESVNMLAKSRKLPPDPLVKAYEIVHKPFAGYKDMDDCISKNQDADDPAAYCATIMRQVEGADKRFNANQNPEVSGKEEKKVKAMTDEQKAKKAEPKVKAEEEEKKPEKPKEENGDEEEKPKESEKSEKSEDVSKEDRLLTAVDKVTDTLKSFDQRIQSLEKGMESMQASNDSKVKLPKDEGASEEPIDSGKDEAEDSEGESEVMEKLNKMEKELIELKKGDMKKVSTPRPSAGEKNVFDSTRGGFNGLHVLKRAREGKPMTHREIADIQKKELQKMQDGIVAQNRGG